MIISRTDPSRYTVYQMLDYVKDALRIALVQKKTANLFLFKTEPFVDSLYNYVHVLSEKFTPADLAVSYDFFGGAIFRIKIPVAENSQASSQDLLLANGFKFKREDYAMIAGDLSNKDHNYSCPANVKILRADDKNILEQVKSIFAEAFDCSLSDYDRKLGFLDRIILADKDKHAKAFVLYENDQPVSTGAYYAFDKFSIENIGTIESARGRGYAGLIMRTLLREAQELGYSEACLAASSAGRPVYQKIGFEILAKTNIYIKDSD